MKKIKKNNEQLRTHIICLRLTDIELSVLDDRAEKCRMTRSDFIRNVILNRKLTPKYQIVIDSEEVKSLLAQYGKIGSNLNQIARHFNSGGERSPCHAGGDRTCNCRTLCAAERSASIGR